MSNIIETVRQELESAIEKDEITLPTLPEVALQVRECANDPDASVASLSKVLGNDAAMSARILKVSNSPLLRGASAIEDIKTAVSRLGLNYTSNLATGLAMEQMFQATSDVVDERMRATWAKSTEVAGISHVLCKHYTRLGPDQATLAGLIYRIGVLPILKFAEEERTELLESATLLDEVIEALHPSIGTLILKHWDFPAELLNVPAEYCNFDRTPDKVDIADIVMVANLQSYIGTDHPYTQMDWTKISAFDRLGLSPEIDSGEDEDLNAEMEAAMSLLAS